MIKGLVSVIVPAYKAEKYISTALTSIEQQSYSNWEILVIEDGWEDKTEEIVNNFSLSCPNHHVAFIKHPKNRGLGATRNTGISKARGEYVAFLDHDDIWLTDHLVHAVSALEDRQGDIAYSTTQMFEDGTDRYLGLWGPTAEEIEDFEISLYRRSFLTPSAVVLGRSVIDKVGLFDTNPALHFSEDHDYWIRAAKQNIKFIHLPNISCLYRKNHPGSATSDPKMIAERQLYVLKKHIDWESIPLEMKRTLFGELYNFLAIRELSSDLSKSLELFLESRKLDPWNRKQIFNFLKATVRLLIQ